METKFEIDLGDISLIVIDSAEYGEKLWIYFKDGEGMPIKEEELRKLLKNYVKENF